MHSVKSNKEEVLSNKEIFQRKYLLVFKAQKNLKEVNKVLKIKTKTATDSITVNGQETPLNIISITLRDERDRI
jgi:hypothetical protein